MLSGRENWHEGLKAYKQRYQKDSVAFRSKGNASPKFSIVPRYPTSKSCMHACSVHVSIGGCFGCSSDACRVQEARLERFEEEGVK